MFTNVHFVSLHISVHVLAGAPFTVAGMRAMDDDDFNKSVAKLEKNRVHPLCKPPFERAVLPVRCARNQVATSGVPDCQWASNA